MKPNQPDHAVNEYSFSDKSIEAEGITAGPLARTGWRQQSKVMRQSMKPNMIKKRP